MNPAYRKSRDAPTKSPWPILFRTEASSRVGLGHMFRCLHMSEGLSVPVAPVVVMRGSPDHARVIEPLVSRGWKIHTIPAEMSDDRDAVESARLAKELGTRLVVTDLCHSEILQSPHRLVRYHRALKAAGASFVLSIEDSRMAGFASHAAVVPYPCDEDKVVGAALDGCRVLAGLRYFISSPAFDLAARGKRIIRKDACRVLVSISGSDPKGITVKLVRALISLPTDRVKARIVLGAGASEKLTRTVEVACANFSNMKVLCSTDDMASEMLWADLAVIGEGLTKFEAAVTGTPSLMISQFDHDSALVRGFLDKGSTQYLGPGDKVTDVEIATAIAALLTDWEARVVQSRAGKAALDSRGLQRITHEVLQEIVT